MTRPTLIQSRLRVGIICADPLRAEGLRAILEGTCDLVLLTAQEVRHFSDLALVLLDTRDEDVLTMIAAFRRARPALPLIVLGGRADPGYVQKVVASGAKGYLVHTASEREIQMAVTVVADGSIWAPRKVLASLIDTYASNTERPKEVHLTAREQEVIELLIAGRANREIAATLGVELKTVKTHVGRLLQKFSVPNRVALTVRALEMKLNNSVGASKENG